MPTNSSPLPSKTNSAVLDVTGMTCASCVRHVERALTAIDGVGAAAVNLATQQARVEFDSAKVRREDLVAAVVGAGYGVRAPGTSHSTG